MSQPIQHPSPSPHWLFRLCKIINQGLKFFWVTVVFGLILNVIASWLTTRSFDPRNTPLEWFLHYPIITLLCIASLLILTAVAWLVGHQDHLPPSSIASRQPTEHSRSICIHTFQKEYQRQLTESLQGFTPVYLTLQERTDIMQSSVRHVPWHMSEPKKGSSYTSIIDTYDEAGYGMVILGAPGSGKSILLRELAIELLNRAAKDTTHPLPVLVNLSSWANKRLSLAEWLVEQLQLVYALPRYFSNALIEQDHLLLLLDGLDEVEEHVQIDCIKTINAYRIEHFAPLVVCSRSQTYVEIVERVHVPLAIEIQPLIIDQIKWHLEQGGEQMQAIMVVLRSNAILRDLVTTPLMLSIVTLAYRGKKANDLPKLGTADEQKNQIFEYYITQMLEQSTRQWLYSPEQTQRWLIWLAQQMKQRHLTEFYLERLQSSWLQTNRLQILYKLLFGLLGCLLFGLPAGLIFGCLDGSGFGLFVGLLFGLPGWPLFGLSKEIQPSEKLTWQWEIRWQELFCWQFVEVGCGLLVGLFSGDPQRGLIISLFFLPFNWLLVGLLLGRLSSAQIDEHKRLKPNQGIQSSGWNALRFILIFELVFGLSIGWASSFFVGLPAVIIGLIGGLIVGSLIGLLYGGITYLQHYLLRLILWQSGIMPGRYIHFLNEACEHILLQRTGGGYRFIHPLFQDYFASLASTPSSSVNKMHNLTNL